MERTVLLKHFIIKDKANKTDNHRLIVQPVSSRCGNVFLTAVIPSKVADWLETDRLSGAYKYWPGTLQA